MKEIVSFFLSGKKYGVEISRMQGIEKYRERVSVVDLPECLQGVIDIRGELIPVVDIRRHLILPPADVTDMTKYLIFRTSHGKLACLIDGVSNIIKVGDENVSSVPPLMQSDTTEYLDFLARSNGELIIVISLENFLSDEDWKKVNETINKVEEKND